MTAAIRYDIEPGHHVDVAARALSILEQVAAGISPTLHETPAEYVQRHLNLMVTVNYITERATS
jgi:hypothetical protein